MNKYKSDTSDEKQHEKWNLNIFSVILTLNSYGYLQLVQKKKFDVLVPAGGVSLHGNMRVFSKEEKYKLFKETVFSLFNKNGNQLYDISSEEILNLYIRVSNKIKKNPAKFNAMLENMQETGRLFYKDLQLLHYEKIGDHEKFFFRGGEYKFFSITGKNMEIIHADESGLDKYPIEGRDFFCQEDDLSETHIDVSLRELLESFEKDGALSKRYGRGAHRKALVKLIEEVSFLVCEENKDLVYTINKII